MLMSNYDRYGPLATGVDVVGFDVSKTVAEEDDYVATVPGHLVAAGYFGDEAVAENE
jgi:hypothetical protein